jgi:molybdenum cofactor cytidylyltransferase
MKKQVSAIILAAGKAKRMGHNKLLMNIGGNTIIEHTVHNVLQSRFHEVLVILGYQAGKIQEILRDKPVQIVINRDYEKGISTSLIKGIQSVSAETTGIMFVLADQPFVNSIIYNKMIESYRTSRKNIVIPVCDNKRGNPIIFGKPHFRQLLTLKGDIGGRQILEANNYDISEVEVNCHDIFFDIDSLPEYHQALQRFKYH